VDDDEAFAEVIEGERRLLDPACRASEACLRDLLHPEFCEFGASGTVWDLDAILGRLTADPGVDGTAEDVVPTRLAADVVLLTFRIAHPERPSLRSSVWVRRADGRWRLRFHQGTRST
jgi:ribonuclease HI